MDTKLKSEPKPIYYGWYIVGALAITETISYGILLYAMQVFIVPLETEFGWSRAEISGAQAVGLLIAGGIGIPVGYWLDKHGSRLLMTVGSLIASILVFMWSFAETLPAFYAVWIAIGITMAMVLYEPAFTVVANWFEQRRGQALAIVTFAAGFASTIFIPLTDWLYNTYGRQDSIIILAIILALGTIPLHAIILRRRPEDLGLKPDGDFIPTKRKTTQRSRDNSVSMGKAIRSRTFWWLTSAFTLIGISSFSMRFHFIPYLIDRGFDGSFAALMGGAIGAMQVAGRVVFAPLEMRFTGRNLAIGIFVLTGISLLVLIVVPNIAGALLFVVLFGTSFGAMTLVRPVILAEYYGPAQYGRISSVMSLFLTVAVASPVVVGFFYDRNGRYEPIIMILIVLVVLSVLTMLRTDG